jgi:hypothetical protein
MITETFISNPTTYLVLAINIYIFYLRWTDGCRFKAPLAWVTDFILSNYIDAAIDAALHSLCIRLKV